MAQKKVDRPFLFIVLILVTAGFFIFSSASLGLLSRGSGNYQAVVFNQVVLGLICGGIASFIVSRISYQIWRKYAFYIFGISILTMLLVFVPGLGWCAKGACRWISVGPFNFQPAEFFKIGFVMYSAAWFASVKNKTSTLKFGTIPFIGLIAVNALVVLTQPDTDTFMVIAAAGVAVFISAGGRWKDLFIMALIGLLGLVILVSMRPYLQQRINTFLDPSKDPSGSSYQIQQSLIAIGSGGFSGRGFGQSIQKFNFLPEPIGDSIFAVAAEEFGFVGSVAIIIFYVIFTLLGLKVAIRAPDLFGSFLVIGLITLITLQSFLNIAAMLAIIPLSGTPLLFISHGGTALFFALVSVGIILNVSRHQKKA